MFIEARKNNWNKLRIGLACLEDIISFSKPTHALEWKENKHIWDNTGCKTENSWFGFMITIKDENRITRSNLLNGLTENKIDNRMFFGGNLTKQPAFIEHKKQYESAYECVGDLKGTEQIMNKSLFLGTYPGLTEEMIDKMIKVVINTCKK